MSIFYVNFEIRFCMQYSLNKKNINKGVVFWSLTIFLINIFHSVAQKSNFGGWYVYNGNQSFKEKWNWTNEFQYRSYDMGLDLEQVVARTGIGYNLSKNNNNVLLGYAFVYSESYIVNGTKKISNIENRIFQQFITRQNSGRVFLQHRYRVEERFLESDFHVRFRYALSLNIPLNNKIMQPKTVYLSLSNELFLILQDKVFDRNRLYGGIGYVINKDLKIEVGVLAQTTKRTQLQISFFNNIPFSMVTH